MLAVTCVAAATQEKSLLGTLTIVLPPTVAVREVASHDLGFPVYHLISKTDNREILRVDLDALGGDGFFAKFSAQGSERFKIHRMPAWRRKSGGLTMVQIKVPRSPGCGTQMFALFTYNTGSSTARHVVESATPTVPVRCIETLP
jgi:hypothetical protein